MFQKGVENLNHLPIVLQPGIAEAQKVADERVVRMRCELALERRNSFHGKLGPEAGQSPVAVQAGEIRLPRGSLLKTLRCSGQLRLSCAHHAPDVNANI